MNRALATMIPLKLSFAVICFLNIWTIGFAQVNEQCNKCRPGEYMKELCSEHKPTNCSACEEGYFSDEFNNFDRCEECLSCQQEYAKKCTQTTNAKCLCRLGFLCSNSVCSTCEENKCATWEKVKRTDIPLGGMTRYSYQCEPACPNEKYFDVKEDTCKPFTQCSTLGFPELFKGNKTHNCVCDTHAQIGRDLLHVILGTGFVLFSLTLLVIISYLCIKNLRMHKANNNPTAVCTSTNDFHLSKEESGLQLIIQDESKNSDSIIQMYLGKVTTV